MWWHGVSPAGNRAGSECEALSSCCAYQMFRSGPQGFRNRGRPCAKNLHSSCQQACVPLFSPEWLPFPFGFLPTSKWQRLPRCKRHLSFEPVGRVLGHHGTVARGEVGRLEKGEGGFDVLIQEKFKICSA